MKVTTTMLAVLLGITMLCNRSSGQPILNRVEQFLRDQVGAVQNPPSPAANAREPGYLGISADDRQDAGSGVRVIRLVPGGPAAQGGLQTGDLITAIDGAPVRAMDDMAQVLEQKTIGSKLTITVDRAGAERQLQVTLGSKPGARPIGAAPESLPAPSDAAIPPGPKLGVRTLPISDEVRQQNNLPDTRGATVIAVTPGSPAERAGIPVGAVITAVNNQQVDSPQTLASAISRSSGDVALSYVADGQPQRRQVALGGPATVVDRPKLELRSRPIDRSAPPASPTAPKPTSPDADDSRAEALEARIRQLEERLQKLEAALAPDAK